MAHTDNSNKKSAVTPPVPPPSVQEGEAEKYVTTSSGSTFTISKVQPVPEEVPINLPPFIITNPRKKIEPESIEQTQIRKFKEKKHRKKLAALMWLGKEEKKDPIPKHPISITWWPKEMCFQLDQKPVVKKLFISNRSPKIMYIHCCGLWDDTARLGASWRCYPRTRILIAPGLVAEMFIKAKPRDESPVPHAYAGLQLATAHTKDIVIGYFVVPIGVIFHNYTAPPMECEAESVEETAE